ncbi:Tigger transposable element-derived protein 6 [Phytophthora ramorum]|nr:Tigger transposable element-derived protein 6 [Phytophthora ramorum]
MTKSIYDALGVPADERLELSNGWLSRFQARHGLKLHKTRGGDTGVDSVEMEQFRLQEVVQEFIAAGGGRTMNDVWNMDEASFFYDCSPVVAVDEDIEVDAMKKVETRLTVTLATNATGSERLEPIFIGHVSQDMKLLGCGRFYCNSTAWMTGDIFCAWLKTWNQELVNASRRVLLLVDKFRGHKADLAALTNIQLEFLSPAVTDFVQPGCVGLNHTEDGRPQYAKLLYFRQGGKWVFAQGRGLSDVYACHDLSLDNRTNFRIKICAQYLTPGRAWWGSIKDLVLFDESNGDPLTTKVSLVSCSSKDLRIEFVSIKSVSGTVDFRGLVFQLSKKQGCTSLQAFPPRNMLAKGRAGESFEFLVTRLVEILDELS